MQCGQWFHDGLKCFFHYLLLNERSDDHYPPFHVRFCLFSIWNDLLIEVLIKNQMWFLYLQTSVNLVRGSNKVFSSAWFCFLLK